MSDNPWSAPRSWEALRHPGRESLRPDEAARMRIARFLGLEGLDLLEATLAHEPWLDGAWVHGRVEALVTRLCGVSLEPFDERVDAVFDLRFLPAGSPNAANNDAEVVVDLDADDPPEVVQGHVIDLGVYSTEILGLALDPFPRKPGAVFDYVDPVGEVSPFAVLKFGKRED